MYIILHMQIQPLIHCVPLLIGFIKKYFFLSGPYMYSREDSDEKKTDLEFAKTFEGYEQFKIG